MMGLMVLGALVVYGLIGLFVVRLAVRQARRRGIKGWKWGLPAGLVVYFLVFQDHIPSVLNHAYQCNFGDAGFRVYKTIDRWRAENPGVWETLAPDALPEEYLVKVKQKAGGGEDRFYLLPDGTELKAAFWAGGKLMTTRLSRPDGTEGYRLNQRFILLNKESRGWFHVYRWTQRILDSQTNERLAGYVDYRSIISLPAFANLKARVNSCEKARGQRTKPQQFRFNKFMDVLQNQREQG